MGINLEELKKKLKEGLKEAFNSEYVKIGEVKIDTEQLKDADYDDEVGKFEFTIKLTGTLFSDGKGGIRDIVDVGISGVCFIIDINKKEVVGIDK